jgi:hypothetical protein
VFTFHAVNFPLQESVLDPKAPTMLKHIMGSPAVRLSVGSRLVKYIYYIWLYNHPIENNNFLIYHAENHLKLFQSWEIKQ